MFVCQRGWTRREGVDPNRPAPWVAELWVRLFFLCTFFFPPLQNFLPKCLLLLRLGNKVIWNSENLEQPRMAAHLPNHRGSLPPFREACPHPATCTKLLGPWSFVLRGLEWSLTLGQVAASVSFRESREVQAGHGLGEGLSFFWNPGESPSSCGELA